MMPTDSNNAPPSGICGRTKWTAARRPIDRGDEQFDHVAKGDDADHAADDQLDRTEARSLEHQHAIGDDRRDRHSLPEAARETAKIDRSRHTRNSARSVAIAAISLAAPHCPHDRLRKVVPAHLRKIASRSRCRAWPKVPGNSIAIRLAASTDPQQSVTIFRAGLDIWSRNCRDPW